MRTPSLVALTLAGLLVIAAPSRADRILWFSPLVHHQMGTSAGVVEFGQPWLQLISAGSPIQTATLDFPLTLPSDELIDSVVVSIQSSSVPFGITNVTLNEVGVPGSVTTLLNQNMSLSTVAGDRYAFNVADAAANGAVTLSLRFLLGNGPSGMVSLGGIGVRLKTPVTAVDERIPAHPLEPMRNRPNPFNTPTAIDYTIERRGHVRLDVFDLQGRNVRSLVDRELVAGKYTERWDGADDAGRLMAAGMYVCRLVVDGQSETRHMMKLE